jgi:hypothetical protein
VLQAILQDKHNFDRANPAVENLITTVESRIRHPPQTEENYVWEVYMALFRILVGSI